MSVKIELDERKVYLTSPFNPDLPSQARALGGKWAGGKWVFDIRDEDRVRDLAREVYGTDGDSTGETVTVRIKTASFAHLLRGQRGPEALFLLGRQIATRRGRDMAVQLGDGVVVVEGGFWPSGGSVKNPCLEPKEGTVLEVRDVPAAHPDLTEYADKVEIVGTNVDVDALMDERERLLARLAEIDALLPEPEGTEVSTREAAAALGVSVRTVQRWAASGKVEAVKDAAGRWVITITLNP